MSPVTTRSRIRESWENRQYDRWRRDPSDIKEIIGWIVFMTPLLWVWMSTDMSSPYGLPSVASAAALGVLAAILIGNPDNHFNSGLTVAAWLAGMFGSGFWRALVQVTVRIFEGILGTLVACLIVWISFGNQFFDENAGAPVATAGSWTARIFGVIAIDFLYGVACLMVLDKYSGAGFGNKLRKGILIAVFTWVGIYYAAAVAGAVNPTREGVTMVLGLDIDLIPLIFGTFGFILAGLAYGPFHRRLVSRGLRA